MKKEIIATTLGLTALLLNQSAVAKSTIGGIIFTNFYTQDIEETDNTNAKTDSKLTKLEIADNSRLRVRWDNEDNVGMYIEMGIGSDVKLRHAYGTWDISETSQLLAGQTSTPFAPLNPSVAMVNNSGDGYGNVSPGRRSQIRYTYKFLNKQGAFAVALVDPTVKNEPATSETTLPRVDMGLAYRTFNWQIFPSIFYSKQAYDGVGDITASGISIGAKTASGPVTFSTEIGAGKNWGNTQMTLGSSFIGDNNGLNSAGTPTQDNDNISYWFDLGYRFTGEQTRGTVHLIYGFSSSELGNSRDLESTMLGISTPIDFPWIARGFRLRPEIFVFNDEDNLGTADKTDAIAGIQLQYTF